MYVESDRLNELRDRQATLTEKISRLEADEGAAPDELNELRERLDRVRREIDRLELAEEVGRQHDA